MLQSDTLRNNIALNLSDCPMGSVVRTLPPGFRIMSSDSKASVATQDMQPINKDTFGDDLRWGTVSLQNSTSWPYIEDGGFATSTRVLTGGKWWALVEQKPTKGFVGNMGTNQAYAGSWEPQNARSDVLQWEAIHLLPESVL